MKTDTPATAAPLPPGRMGLPLLGETLAFLKDSFVFFEERFREHGPVFKTRILGDPVLCFVGPEALSFFYDERTFTRADANPPHVRELLHPDAIPFLDGPRQQKRRRALLHAFTPEALAGYQPVLEQVVRRYLRRWEDGQERRGVDELGALCLAVSSGLFTGGDPERDDPALAARVARLAAGMLSPPIKLPFTTFGKALRARDELRAYVSQAVDGYQEGTAQHVLQRVLEARGEGGALGRDEIKIEMLHFFIAACAVLQAALCNLVMALPQHPEVMRRVREEARALPEGTPLLAGAGRPRYIDQVCREVRRRYPLVAPTFFATVKADTEWGGYRIPKGWKAVGALHSTMHDERTFAQADRFDPDRFAEERAASLRPNSYVPHGGGPWEGHRCAGEALADRLLNTFTALALREHTWELPSQDLSYKQGGLCPLPRDGLRVRFTRA